MILVFRHNPVSSFKKWSVVLIVQLLQVDLQVHVDTHHGRICWSSSYCNKTPVCRPAAQSSSELTTWCSGATFRSDEPSCWFSAASLQTAAAPGSVATDRAGPPGGRRTKEWKTEIERYSLCVTQQGSEIRIRNVPPKHLSNVAEIATFQTVVDGIFGDFVAKEDCLHLYIIKVIQL